MSCLPRILAVALLIALAPASASAQRHHTVRPGQSLARIARHYHVSVSDLALANRMQQSHVLRPGEMLTVPPDGVTYVARGQTLSEIAADHHCSVGELQRLNHLRRGRGLRIGQRLILPGFVPAEERAAADRDWGEPETPNVAHIRRHDEVATVPLLDEEGHVTDEALSQLAQLMRRHDDDPPELPHPRLALLLAAVSNHFGGRQITLVSGRREPVRFTRSSSRHVVGQATDIRVEGVPRRVLWDYCRTLASTGCGYYPRSTFVHVDVREHAAQWVDWSRPGRRPRYGNLRGPWRRACRRARRRGRRSRACARETRHVTRPDEVPLEAELTEAAHQLMPQVPDLTPGDEPDDADEGGES